MRETEWFEICSDCGDIVPKGEHMQHFPDCAIYGNTGKHEIFKVYRYALLDALQFPGA